MDDIERRVRDIVAGIADAEVMDCDPALADTADFCAAYGIAMDDSANAKHGPRISTATSRTAAWVIPTNEELMIARHTRDLLAKS